MQRHEVPIHLNVEDKAFAGLMMRQLMVEVIGLALAQVSGMAFGRPKSVGNGALERNESEIGAVTPRLERAERNHGTLRERRFAS